MYEITVEPRFGDIDGLRHINNTVVAIWFEQARNPFFKMFTPNLSTKHEDWKLIMAHTDFDFVSQMELGKNVQIRSYVSRIGNKSFTLYHEAWQDGVLCVKGKAVVVHFDFIEQKSVPIPEDIRNQLMEHYIELDKN
ncbi:acyl-CoA thioester hydrolase [Methanococcus voltae]|uniref:acyl-CoA thioesterase n=1 Tax=Methanococcus voltae TaxID=2188 RepID=UPI001AE504C3|nr:thioesterase family protein [Methanococcus voltae]MBP2144420.1 acyl-CoA thioester hydrolase [Methanococcus voltae]